MIFHPLASHPASRTFPSPITNGGGAPDDSDGGPAVLDRGGVPESVGISACGLGLSFAAMEGLGSDMASACGAIYEKLGLNHV